MVLKYFFYSILYYSYKYLSYLFYSILFVWPSCFYFLTSRIPEKLYRKVDAYLNKRREREARLAASLNMKPNR